MARGATAVSVDEVADATGEEPDTGQRHDEIEHVGHAAPAAPGVDRDGHDHAEHPAVERHAAFPDLERIPRILRPVGHAIEQDVADAPAEDDAEHRVEDEVVHVVRAPGGARTAGPHAAEPPPGGEADEIHDPVPVHADRADQRHRHLESDRVEAGVLQH
jgi:hypothetical protein